MRTRVTVATLAALVACGDMITATQVMVRIDAQPQIRAVASDVRVAVRAGQGDMGGWEERYDMALSPDTDELSWPIELSILPKSDDATRVYEVTATALDADGVEFARVRAISGFVRNELRTLTLQFDDSCVDRSLLCNATETCRAGDCVDAHVDTTLLVPYPPDAGSVVLEPFDDSSIEGGTDHPTDANYDAGLDSGARERDAAADAAAPALPSVPNIDTDSLNFDSAPDVTITCGDVTIDTTGPSIVGWCGDAVTTVIQQQQEGPEIVVVALRSLNIPSGRTIRAVGSRPLAFVVAGDATVDGTIDASADGAVPGAGGNVSCTVGIAPSGSGGGGGFGTRGGGHYSATGTLRAGGAVEGSDDLVPLRGGCAGNAATLCIVSRSPYLTTSGPAGAGGGAIQLVVAGRLGGSGEIRAVGGNGSASCDDGDRASGGGSGGAVSVATGDLDEGLRLLVSGGSGGTVRVPAGLVAPGVSDPQNVGVADIPSSVADLGAGGGYGRIKVWL